MTIHSDHAPRLEDLPVHPIVSISPAASLRTLARAICAHDNALVLVGGTAEPDAGRAVVTERDLTRALAEGRSPDSAVKDIATPVALTLPASATVMDAATLMLCHDADHLVVTRDDHSLGVVSLHDLLARFDQTVTTDTVFIHLGRSDCDRPELWLG
jgi:signal-transduction protein with cAMP-binding, CBS, and nucleotidyltransferase domain